MRLYVAENIRVRISSKKPVELVVPGTDDLRERLSLLLTCDAMLQYRVGGWNRTAYEEYRLASITGIRVVTTKQDIGEIVNFSTIITQIASLMGIRRELLLSPTRRRNVVDARRIIAAYLRQNARLSLSRIGNLIDRDHTDVLYLLKSHNSLMDTDRSYRNLYDGIVDQLSLQVNS